MTDVLLALSALCGAWILGDLVLAWLDRFSRRRQELRVKSMVASRRTALPLEALLSYFEKGGRHFLGAAYFQGYFNLLASLIRRANLLELRPEHILGYQVLASLAACLVFGGLSGSPELAFLTLLMGGCLPLVWLRDQALRRERRLLRELPNSLEVISLCSEAGLSLEQGIEQYLKNARPGPICEELGRLQEQTRTGSSRKEALEAMSDRLGLMDFSLFTSSLIHAERFGTGVAKTLRQLSVTLRDKQYQRAEKAVQEMPVKLLLPLVFFILPVTFLIIFGPIALQFFR